MTRVDPRTILSRDMLIGHYPFWRKVAVVGMMLLVFAVAYAGCCLVDSF